MVPAGTYGNLQHFKHGAQEWAWVSITYERHVRGIRAFTQTVTAGETNATAIEAEAATARAAEEANAAAISENLYFISTSQNDISTNTDAITNLQADQSAQNAAINLNSGKAVQISTNTDAITNLRAEQSSQNAAINLNSNKAGISSEQANEIVKNTAKVGQASGTTTGDMQYWDGTAWVVITTTLNEGAALQMISGVPTWIGGTPPPPPPAIGDLRDGGIVFWVDGNGGGKVCTLEGGRYSDGQKQLIWDAEIELTWDEAMSLFNSHNYTNSDTGTGVYDDWLLPSRDELQLMYVNLQRFGCSTNTPGSLDSDLCATRKANFTNYYYWSSAEFDANNVWNQNFYNGVQNYYSESNTYYVRAVRAF
jgi:hypothetical protein